jgi:hypothetical protein
MDFQSFLDILRLDVVVALAGGVGIITEVVKKIPLDWLNDKPKTIAWIISAVIVGGIGVYEKADVVTIVTVTTAVALVSHGLFDIVSGIWLKIKK